MNFRRLRILLLFSIVVFFHVFLLGTIEERALQINCFSYETAYRNLRSHQVPEEVKAERSAILQKLNEAHQREFESYYLGRPVEVLFEEKSVQDGLEYYTGHTREYMTVTVLAKGRDLQNKICDCIFGDSDVQ